MTTSDPVQGRPIPDGDDLRLLAELINNGAIPLAQAAWNARMGQPEAAARLVEMAERGMPLRLMAEGDQQMLWRIAQAGPATVEPVSGAPVAVPLGQPPFGPPPAEPVEEAPPAQETPPAASAAEEAPPKDPTRRVMTSGRPTQPVTGGSGEELDVSLLQIIDPADQILATVGYRPGPDERSLLVQTSVGNRGTVDYGSLPDAHLVLRDEAGNILPKSHVAVGDYPAYQSSLPGHTLMSGWTVFLVPAATEVTEVRWSVRPDEPTGTAVWTFGPG